MASPRRPDVRLAYSSTFATESAFGTALANSAHDAVFALDETEPQVEVITQDDQIIDCTGEYEVDEVTLGRSSRISFGIYVEGATLFGLLGLGMGVVAGNVVTMLAPGSYQPAPTSLIYGHKGSSVTPLKFKDMVLDSIRITGRVVERVKAQIQLRGHGAPAAASGFTFPDCATPAPIYIKDGAFSLNSVDRAADLREFDFNFNNRLIFEEDPFPFAGIDIVRMERDKREYPLTIKLFGEIGDSTYAAALAKAKQPFSLRIGSATDGVTIASTGNAILKQNGSPTHEGRAARSVLNLLLQSIRGSGVSSPITVTRNIP